jgi:alpha-tubulin suppressor-like RCC1 family protein
MCLGRDIESKNNKAAIVSRQNNLLSSQTVEIDQIQFPGSESDVNIINIATGRSHVIALDTQGRVWSWGENKKG